MPIAHLYIIEGREPELKRVLIEKVTDALCEALGARRESVRVLIQEVPKEHWGIGGQSAKELGR